MKNLKENPIYDKVKECTNERELSDVISTYSIINISDTPGISGYVYIFEDGHALCVPYSDVLTDAHFEQLMIDKAFEPCEHDTMLTLQYLERKYEYFKSNLEEWVRTKR